MPRRRLPSYTGHFRKVTVSRFIAWVLADCQPEDRKWAEREVQLWLSRRPGYVTTGGIYG